MIISSHSASKDHVTDEQNVRKVRSSCKKLGELDSALDTFQLRFFLDVLCYHTSQSYPNYVKTYVALFIVICEDLKAFVAKYGIRFLKYNSAH